MHGSHQNPGQHRLRQGRFSETGRYYVLTTVSHNRRPVFTDLQAARMVILSLRRHHKADWVRSLAYVLMPDHLHWLVELRPGTDLADLMRSVKGYTGHRINQMKGNSGANIWQPGFHDCALRQEEDLRTAARYLVANPLRAGLTTTIGDYPHWDAMWLEPGTEVARSLD